MAREMTGLKFYFRNGETWTIDRRFIGDLWIKHITLYYNQVLKPPKSRIRDVLSCFKI